MRNLLEHIAGLPRNLIVRLITFYQHTLSPDHGPFKHLYAYGYCRHSPTCSVYAKKVIEERGVLIGMPMAFWRLIRCNPFAKADMNRLLEIVEKQHN